MQTSSQDPESQKQQLFNATSPYGPCQSTKASFAGPPLTTFSRSSFLPCMWKRRRIWKLRAARHAWHAGFGQRSLQCMLEAHDGAATAPLCGQASFPFALDSGASRPKGKWRSWRLEYSVSDSRDQAHVRSDCGGLDCG